MRLRINVGFAMEMDLHARQWERPLRTAKGLVCKMSFCLYFTESIHVINITLHICFLSASFVWISWGFFFCLPGYVDIGLIPEGARDIRIEEVAEAENYLALRSNDPDKYFLNGGWTIQWNGEYKAAGTVFTYERTGQLENISSPGPTMEPVWIQVLTSMHLSRI